MKEFYQQTKEELLQQFHAAGHGLSGEEAKKCLVGYGENTLKGGKRKSTLQVLFEQFRDLLVVILIVAALISMVSGNVESTIVIIAVIVLDAILGTVQHIKAEESLGSLKSPSFPNAKVLRDGQKIGIPSVQMVPGDTLYLEAGDLVMTDNRILENYPLQVNESSPTGESVNIDRGDRLVHNDCALAGCVNMMYLSGLVTCGRTVIPVTSIGMGMEAGKVAALMNVTKEKKTPLQTSLDRFRNRLAMGIIVICGLIFLLSLCRGMPVLDSLMFVAALAVAVILEAPSSIITIVQAMGTQKMAKEHAIIKELKAVENLGCISVICSDKTRTLTQNKMIVQNIYINQEIISVDQLNPRSRLHHCLLYGAVLTNDSSIVDGEGIGDPMESVPVGTGRKAMMDENLLWELMSRLEEIPSDSDRRLTSTKYELYDIPTVPTKGTLDVLSDRTVEIRMESGARDIIQKDEDAILQKNLEFSQEGPQVLVLGYKEVPGSYTSSLDNENDFIFLGLILMMGPPGEEPKVAVADAKRAGIKPMMITGDHKTTAMAIVKQIGIFEDGDTAMTGRELDVMTEEGLDRNITSISVYARVPPENKIHIMDAWQRRGSITAMTGDGVNNAPVPKKVGIGAAMSITKMEVSKDAAAIILTDDNFATIIKTVTSGCNVYRNIKNATKFLLSGNMVSILSVLYASLAVLPVSFVPARLLFISLLIDSLPAIAIGMEPIEKDLLAEAPRNPKTGILTKDFMLTILTQDGVIAVCTMTAFHMGPSGEDTGIASTIAFFTLILARLSHGFNYRNKHNIFRLSSSSNWYSLGAFVADVCLLEPVMFVPFLQKLFSTTPLSSAQMGEVCLLAMVPIAIIRVSKILRDFSHRN